MQGSRQVIALSIGILFSCHVFANDITGLWKAHDDQGEPTGYIRIMENNDEYIGVIEKGLPSDKKDKICTACKKERKNQKLIGMVMMKGVVAKGGGRYSGSEILDPFSGNTYRVKLQLKDAGQRLLVRGYVGMSLFGRTQEWRRAENGQ